MPKKVLPDREAFECFTKKLLRRGFRKLLPEEFRENFDRMELSAPSPREGRETGFIYKANGLTVLVWTTFLDQEDQARNTDAGWVLIKEGEAVEYFSHPLHRTKNFLHNLLLSACIARFRALNRPACPSCGVFMDIARGKNLKARYWQCNRPMVHKKPEFLPWDYGIPKEALKFLILQRGQRARYRKKRRAQGKKTGTAILQRRGWKKKLPDTIVPVR